MPEPTRTVELTEPELAFLWVCMDRADRSAIEQKIGKDWRHVHGSLLQKLRDQPASARDIKDVPPERLQEIEEAGGLLVLLATHAGLVSACNVALPYLYNAPLEGALDAFGRVQAVRDAAMVFHAALARDIEVPGGVIGKGDGT